MEGPAAGGGHRNKLQSYLWPSKIALPRAVRSFGCESATGLDVDRRHIAPKTFNAIRSDLGAVSQPSGPVASTSASGAQ